MATNSKDTTAPNVVVILLDDLGFADLGCYGSSIATPNADTLAARGLRYNSFHVTSICSSSRACILTGRNHHAVGMGALTNWGIDAPGYTGRIPKSVPTLPARLRDAGYNTFAVGKWHLSPPSENGASGPFDLWPLGLGFERYYGFLDGLTNQWTPRLVRDNGVVEQPLSPEEGYHITDDLATQAIRFIQDQKQDAPDKPFFLYFAPGAPHSPHHVHSEWVEPYRGTFDEGWEVVRERTFRNQQDLGIVPPGTSLTERPPWVAAWDTFSADERRLFARQMEVYAGFLTHTDAQIGRLLDFLARLEVLDNTIVMLMSDNGASAEGGPLGEFSVGDRDRSGSDDALTESVQRIDELGGFRAQNHYAWGWAWTGNCPFRLWKRYSWLGGVRVPLVVQWPAGIARENAGQVRRQFCHAVDVMPSLLEVTGATAAQAGSDKPRFDGTSLVPTFDDAEAPGRSTQYFEMLGSRAMYHEGWKATTNHVSEFMRIERELIEGSHDFEADRWSLFHLEEDFSESDDVADDNPERLRQLIELWWYEAGRNQVLPLADTPGGGRLPGRAAQKYTCLPGAASVVTPDLAHGFRLFADVEVEDGAEVAGILCANGDWTGGWACYVLDGCLVAAFTFGDAAPHRIATGARIEPGRHRIGVEYLPYEDAESLFRVTLDGREVGAEFASIDRWTWMARFLGAYGHFGVGRDQGFPVCDDYSPPFPFTGQIHRVEFEIPATPEIPNPAVELEGALRQD